MKKLRDFSLGALLMTGAMVPAGLFAQGSIEIEVDAGKTEELISEYLTGSHFVYGFENDTLYQDERISDWMKACRVKTIRWPGGTAVQEYHWDDLNGISFNNDSWNPKYTGERKNPESYMDLDEYIAYCRKIGAEPMVGINIQSGMKYNGPGKGKEGSLDEARRLIQYCKDKNYNVKNWYIGNECYKIFRKQNYINYADCVDEYAEVLRKVDPDINIIGDWQFGGRFDQVVNLALKSKQMNMMEIHEKWGNGFGLATKGKDFASWKKESPIYDGKLGNMIDRFRDTMTVHGRDVKMAMNEWGLSGKRYGEDVGEFEAGLMAADFLMELFRHKIAMACYWNLNMGGKYTRILETVNPDSTCNDHVRLNRITSVAHGFTMLSTAMGKHLINFNSPIREVYGFAALNPNLKEIHVYLLSKKDDPVTVSLKLKNFSANNDIVQYYYAAPGDIREKTYSDGKQEVVLPGISFSHIVLKADDATGLDQIDMQQLEGKNEIYDLAGRQRTLPQKGINVVNGMKVLVK